MYFGKTIKLFRTSKELKQTELAAMLSITTEYLSKLENDAKTPSMVLLLKLSQVLEIPLQLLIFTSLEETDFPVAKRKSFKATKPVLNKLLNNLLGDDEVDFEETTRLLIELKELRSFANQKVAKIS